MKKLVIVLLVFILSGFIVTLSEAGTPYYITPGGSGLKNGSDWSNAGDNIQTGIDNVASSGGEIWVASGIYTPTAILDLKKGAKLYGGFIGTETQKEISINNGLDGGRVFENDYPKNASVLDGKNNKALINTGDHATSQDTVIDGFTIQNGKAQAEKSPSGGIYNFYFASPTIANCTFISNFSETFGGAINNWNYSDPIIMNCIFSKNYGRDGGAIYNYYSSSKIINCSFYKNTAIAGGAINNMGFTVSSTIEHCFFTANSADNGGAIYNRSSCTPTINDCSFASNSASDGGAIYNILSAKPIITNCVFSGNSALYGADIRDLYDSVSTISDCIFLDE